MTKEEMIRARLELLLIDYGVLLNSGSYLAEENYDFLNDVGFESMEEWFNHVQEEFVRDVLYNIDRRDDIQEEYIKIGVLQNNRG